MLLYLFGIVSSILLGATLGRFISKILAFQKGFNLFGSGVVDEVRLFSESFAQQKSYDLLEFWVTLICTAILFGLFYFLYRKRKLTSFKATLVGASFLIFAVIINLSTLFASYSGTVTVGIIFSTCLLLTLLSKNIPSNRPLLRKSTNAIVNGIIVGFYFSVLFHKLSPSIALSLAPLFITPIYFYLFCEKYQFLKHPGYLILLATSIYPYNKTILAVVGFITPLLIFSTRNKIPLKLSRGLNKIYPAFGLFIFLYNPTFYFGSFDTVEEGFWAGWLQRILEGQLMYRDFAMYHPPLLSAGLSGFTTFFGASLYTIRLYFHLLQIVGAIILSVVVTKLTKSWWIRGAIFILVVSYSFSMVRNNVEIRLASGLLPLLFVYWYHLKTKKRYLFLAGMCSAIALFVSIETGIASVISLGVVTLFTATKKKYVNTIAPVFAGGIVTLMFFLLFLYTNQSFSKFFEYIVFYARSFSLGYQNILINRPEASTQIQWSEVIAFTSTSGFLWSVTSYIVIGALLFGVVLYTKKRFEAKDVLFCGVSIFALVLTRSALGRSDYYHIVFVWILALLLLAYLLEHIRAYSRWISVVLTCFLLFFVSRNATQSLLQQELIKFQSYGNPEGSYPSYATVRAQILVGKEINTQNTDNLVSFISTHAKYNESIYIFPQAPELYFLADRKNATSFDTPTTFYSRKYQNQTIEELKMNKPVLVVYEPTFAIGGISINTLSEINNYIIENFKPMAAFGATIVMQNKR